ncbi:T53I2 protein, partial [Hylia prasina]|nr:T53I2 protein [Hylia prasina]
MFQRLTSLFFSDSNTPEGLEELKPFVEEEDEEDGWLIIDLAAGVAAAQKPPGASMPGGDPGKAPAREITQSLETPAPSFPLELWWPAAAPSLAPSQQQRGNLENLWIQPLSDWSLPPVVHIDTALPLPSPVPSNPPDESGNGDMPEPRPELPLAHHGRALAVKAAALDKAGQAQRAQRAKQLAERHRLGQKALQRQNRARQRPPRRAKQLPGAFVHQPCQRHCNY